MRNDRVDWTARIVVAILAIGVVAGIVWAVSAIDGGEIVRSVKELHDESTAVGWLMVISLQLLLRPSVPKGDIEKAVEEGVRRAKEES